MNLLQLIPESVYGMGREAEADSGDCKEDVRSQRGEGADEGEGRVNRSTLQGL
jgi:hypothetical protein